MRPFIGGPSAQHQLGGAVFCRQTHFSHGFGVVRPKLVNDPPQLRRQLLQGEVRSKTGFQGKLIDTQEELR
ncbi:hypothetical protein [Stenotrophomonas maltophilia]|uniref:hypothetical protein n=1 Tax=Stenotrophomonas maltophilia TaxID=40324 RepID=UPI0014324328|nr:hypothetical protein [Stenotrophomonas maltophilia]